MVVSAHNPSPPYPCSTRSFFPSCYVSTSLFSPLLSISSHCPTILTPPSTPPVCLHPALPHLSLRLLVAGDIL
ncbi:hypothetical protein EON63_20445 [archaeon]|nr:MAG: hypothetical protein EON63_20445 [archaeon]